MPAIQVERGGDGVREGGIAGRGAIRGRVTSPLGARVGQHMNAAIDAVIRAWLVVGAWLRLHRKPALHRLARIRRPMGFVRAALVPAGRVVALAIALLPRKHRREAAITYVACKALAAFDDADAAVATGRITAAVHYLTGDSAEVPRIGSGQTTQVHGRERFALSPVILVLAASPRSEERRVG